MWSKLHILLIFPIFFVNILAFENADNRARFDNYRIYRIQLGNQRHVDVFQEVEKRSDSYQFYGHAEKPGQKVTILVAAHKIAEITDILETFQVDHEILSYNFQEKIDKELEFVMPKDVAPDNMDWDHFFQLEAIYAWMDKMAADYENVATISLGTSTQRNQIKGLKIGNNPANTAVFIESGIHAREWIAPATATYIINELITSKNEAVRKFAENFNFFIVPVFNVDGYLYTFRRDRMWRKNRQLYGTCRGVDLNRNYPYYWNTTGSSPDPCRYDYAGPAAASESETQRLMKFVQEHVDTDRIKTYIALHSYSQLIMFPYGTTQRVKNYDDLEAIGQKASETIERISGRKYKSGSIYNTIYPSSGCSQDWVRNVTDIPIAFTFELRGPPTSPDLFILPKDEIRPTAEEIFAAILTILDEAGKRGYYNLSSCFTTGAACNVE